MYIFGSIFASLAFEGSILHVIFRRKEDSIEDFCENNNCKPNFEQFILFRSSGKKGKCLGADLPPPTLWVLKGPKGAGIYRVNSSVIRCLKMIFLDWDEV